jgi:hypothetical protein
VFFQQYSTEAEADLCAYAPHLHGLSMGHSPIRMLDFGCGDGGFAAEFLGRSRFPQERLWLSLVEPDASYWRFLMGRKYHAIPRQALLECFDLYSHAGQIAMQLVHKHFMVRRPAIGRVLLEE